MTRIFQNHFNDPFPSLYPYFLNYNDSFETHCSYPHQSYFPFQGKVIVYLLSYRTMKIRMTQTIGAIKKMMRELLAFVSLLFGMCSSQSCFILNAFCGTMLYRFPNYTFFNAIQFIPKLLGLIKQFIINN
jgi:hypothetical protein